MTKKEQFIKEVGELIKNKPLSANAMDYFNGLQVTGDSGKPKFTKNGKLVLQYMQQNKDTYNNLFKAKDIGEGMGISSRTASGAMRKLVTDGWVERIGENPVVYSLTDKGTVINPNEEEG